MDAVARIRTKIVALYGDRSLESDEGVVHVAAVHEQADAFAVLRIGPGAPKSATDTFVLALARARADVVITTGKILRDEPSLAYDLPSDSGDLLAWRRAVLGRPELPVLVVLTRGDIPPDHPALHGVMRPIPLAAPLRDAIAFARSTLAARTVLVEAGPSTATLLYDPPCVVDELMLSVFEGPALAPGDCARHPIAGRPFVARDRLESVFGPIPTGVRVVEPDGPWRFRRMRNKTGGAAVRS